MKLQRWIGIAGMMISGLVLADEPQLSSFAYILQADAFALSKDKAVEALRDSGRDWVVLDTAFGDNILWNKTDLHNIRQGKTGRKMICYISIGEAEEYRPYWNKTWGKGGKLTALAPAWLGDQNPKWKGNYQVHYWNKAWQEVILKMVTEAMQVGFDGLYLDIVDGFENFERENKKHIPDKINPESQQSFRRDMVDWVNTIAAEARKINPSAMIIPQNGSQLLVYEDYVKTISAIGIEDLFMNGNKTQSKSHTAEVLSNLEPFRVQQKPVLLIEYPKNESKRNVVLLSSEEHGMTVLITDRGLKTLGFSGKK